MQSVVLAIGNDDANTATICGAAFAKAPSLPELPARVLAFQFRSLLPAV
jgi:hypothetical protein